MFVLSVLIIAVISSFSIILRCLKSVYIYFIFIIRFVSCVIIVYNTRRFRCPIAVLSPIQRSTRQGHDFIINIIFIILSHIAIRFNRPPLIAHFTYYTSF